MTDVFALLDQPLPTGSVELLMVDGPLEGLIFEVPLHAGDDALPRPAAPVDVQAAIDGTVEWHRYMPVVSPMDDGPLWMLTYQASW
ncbi:hypothetical protein [Saccharothrix hoggarensis]|uniref:Uncharacterized protein n=1 Tax=Saccharothrix hoggarensis TaxID=913853 RepID=A0ABW3QGC7_9PSEU